MESSKKRKRDADYPRIAYHTSTRTFDRLFRENSLAEMKDVARRKLGLDATTSVSFAQIREGKTVDLEDDDDFDAFYSLAHSTKSVDVKVTVDEQPDGTTISIPATPTKKRKRRRNKEETAEQGDEPALPTEHENTRAEEHNASAQALQTLTDLTIEPPRKKKKRKVDIIVEDDGARSDLPEVLHQTKHPLTVPGVTAIAKHSIGDRPIEPTDNNVPTIEQQKPKKARKKRKGKEQTEDPSMDEKTFELSSPAGPRAAKRRKAKGTTHDASEGPEQHVGVIPVLASSKIDVPSTDEHDNLREKSQGGGHALIVHPCMAKSVSREKEETKKATPEPAHENMNTSPVVPTKKSQLNTKQVGSDTNEGSDGGLKDDSPSVIQRKAKKETRKLTVEERKSAVADLDDIFAKVVAKRAAAVTSANITRSEVGQADDVVVLSSKSESKKKKKKSGDETLQSDSVSTTSIALPQDVADRPTPAYTSRAKDRISLCGPSSEPTCPLCLLTPLHDRDKCPLVLGGYTTLQKRLSEIEETSDDGKINREIIAELRQLIRQAKKAGKDAGAESSSLNSQSLQFQNRDSAVTNLEPTTHPTDVSSQLISSKKAPSLPLSFNKAKPPSGVLIEPPNHTSDTSSDESPDEPSVLAEGLLQASQDPTFLANVNLDDLIRGPGVPAIRIADLHSPDTSDEEEDRAEDQVLEEDEPEGRRRSHRKSGAPDSSDDADSGLDDAQSILDGPQDDSPPRDASPLDGLLTSSGADHVSFRAVDRIGESEEVDHSGDVAFGAALESESAILNDAGVLEGPTSSEPAAGTSQPMAPSPIHVDQDNTFDVTPPIYTSTPAPAVGPSTALPLVSPPLTNLRVSPSTCDTRDGAKTVDVKPTGIIQRMKTRNGKAPINEKSLDTPTQPPRARSTHVSQDVTESAARRTRASIRQQTLGAMTPPVLPPKAGRQSRVIRSSATFQSTEDTNVPSSTSQDGMSLDTWATLKPSSPIPDADATMMVDELEPSSPIHDTHMDLGYPNKSSESQDVTTEDPLFFPTDSLPPFPYSQWNDESQKEIENNQDESNDQDEIEVPVQQSQPKPKPSQNPKYRRLTDITSDHGLFTTPPNLRATRSSMAAKKTTDMYGRSGKDEIESSESESDNSDAQEKSHIPKARMAGVKQTKRK
ncbi:hypothetical protein DXG01_013641 [Tephrocybe rancida]|nr:hypothetical protein DXG01_013641 [Tephrocybe rancida]